VVNPSVLSDLDFFDELSGDMISRLAAIAEMREYEAGVFLNSTSLRADYFYVILSGEISLEIESVTGKRVRLETIAPGSAIGFSSLIDIENKRYLSDAKTLTPVKLLRFKPDEMTLLFYQDFELGYLIMKKIALIAKQRLIHRTYPISKLG
jgi:CRP/FNR family transcriptional regulator, cyclic AMP receptor protein